MYSYNLRELNHGLKPGIQLWDCLMVQGLKTQCVQEVQYGMRNHPPFLRHDVYPIGLSTCLDTLPSVPSFLWVMQVCTLYPSHHSILKKKAIASNSQIQS